MSDELDIRIDNDLAQNDSGNILGSKTIEDVIKKEAKEEQEPSSRFSISRTLGGVIIARFAQRQMKLMLLICALLILHISCRYMCQKKLVELDRLEVRIVEAHNKAIVCSSILTGIAKAQYRYVVGLAALCDLGNTHFLKELLKAIAVSNCNDCNILLICK